MRNKRFDASLFAEWVCVFAVSVGLAGCSIPREQVAFQSTDPALAQSETPQLNQSVSVECLPGAATVVAAGVATISLTSSSRSDGSILLSESSTLNRTNDSRLVGAVHTMAPNALSFLYEDLRARSRIFVRDLALAEVRSPLTMARVSELTVIEVDGDIELGGNDQFVLQGGWTDRFLVRVKGNIRLSGRAGIVLAGGLVSKNVAIEVVGGEAVVSLEDSASLVGTLMADQGRISVHGASVVVGAILSRGAVEFADASSIVLPTSFCLDETFER